MPPAQDNRGWLRLFYANVFFACVSFSICVPTLYGYLLELSNENNGTAAPNTSHLPAPFTSPSTMLLHEQTKHRNHSSPSPPLPSPASSAPLGNPELFYAVTVSIYSIGEMVGSIVFGMVYKKWAHKPKAVLMACILTGLLGSLLFLFAGLPGMLSPWLAFAGRLVQGLWTGGQQVIEQAFLSENVPINMRTEVTATLGSCAVLGFVSGPAFATVLAFIDVTLKNGYVIDKDTSPAIFMVLVAFLMAICTMVFFKPGSNPAEDSSKSTNAEGGEIEKVALLGSSDGNDDVHEEEAVPTVAPASTTGIVVCLVAFFVHFYCFAIYETIMTPLIPALYSWSPKAVDLLFVGAGVVSLLASLAVKFASRVVSDYVLLQTSLACGVVGCLLLINFPGYTPEPGGAVPLAGFMAGFTFIVIAFPIGRNVVLSLYSQILGPAPQGMYMGAMLAVGAIPRAAGPFWAIIALCIPQPGGDAAKYPDSLCHHDAGEIPETWLIFGSTAAFFVAVQMLCVVFKDSLKPHPAGDGSTGGADQGKSTTNDNGSGRSRNARKGNGKGSPSSQNIYEDDDNSNDEDSPLYFPVVESGTPSASPQYLLASNSLDVGGAGGPSPARPVPKRQRSGMMPNDPFKSSFNLEGLSGSFKSVNSSPTKSFNPSTTPRSGSSAYFTPGATPIASSLGRALSSIGGAINRVSSWDESSYKDSDRIPWERRSSESRQTSARPPTEA